MRSRFFFFSLYWSSSDALSLSVSRLVLSQQSDACFLFGRNRRRGAFVCAFCTTAFICVVSLRLFSFRSVSFVSVCVPNGSNATHLHFSVALCGYLFVFDSFSCRFV